MEDGDIAVLSKEGMKLLWTSRAAPLQRQVQRHRVGPRGGGEGRLRALHAQGDPRAAQVPEGRHRGQAQRADRRRGAEGDQAVPGRDQRYQAHHHHCLRHVVPRRPDRQVRPGDADGHPGQRRDRLGVQVLVQPRRARHAHRRAVPVGRDGGHGRRGQGRGQERRPRDRHHQHRREHHRPGGEQHDLHELRPGDRRGGHEDVHVPGHAHVPARHLPRPPPRRTERRERRGYCCPS